MADNQAILEEEFEVLESIFPDEIEKLGESSLRIRIEPEEPSASHPLKLYLTFNYPAAYPDVIPDLSLEPVDEEEDEDETGELSDEEEESVLAQLRTIAEESLGMAMSFTIVSSAREILGTVVSERWRREKEEEDRKAAEYEEMEAKRTRGTPLTPATFNDWRKKFMAALKAKREREEDDRVRALPPKEKEEWKRRRDRLSGELEGIPKLIPGRQLFEQSKVLATSDEALYEEGAASVDISQYSREQREAERRKEEEEEENRRKGLVADDSDGE